jgi:hypothetical protein
LVFTFVMGACARDRDDVTVLGTLSAAIAASAIAAAAIIELL